MHRFNTKVVLRYVLLQLPALAVFSVIVIWLQIWLQFPQILIYLLITLWMVKDVVMFFFVWPAYDQSNRPAIGRIHDEMGITVEKLAPEGYIRIGSELWRARLLDDQSVLASEMKVRVIKHEGLTLIVVPEKSE